MMNLAAVHKILAGTGYVPFNLRIESAIFGQVISCITYSYKNILSYNEDCEQTCVVHLFDVAQLTQVILKDCMHHKCKSVMDHPLAKKVSVAYVDFSIPNSYLSFSCDHLYEQYSKQFYQYADNHCYSDDNEDVQLHITSLAKLKLYAQKSQDLIGMSLEMSQKFHNKLVEIHKLFSDVFKRLGFSYNTRKNENDEYHRISSGAHICTYLTELETYLKRDCPEFEFFYNVITDKCEIYAVKGYDNYVKLGNIDSPGITDKIKSQINYFFKPVIELDDEITSDEYLYQWIHELIGYFSNIHYVLRNTIWGKIPKTKKFYDFVQHLIRIDGLRNSIKNTTDFGDMLKWIKETESIIKTNQ